MKRLVALIGWLSLSIWLFNTTTALCAGGKRPQLQLKLVKEITLEKPMVAGISFPNDIWKALGINYDGLLKGKGLKIFVNTGNGVIFLNFDGKAVYKKEFGADEKVTISDDGKYLLVSNWKTFDARMENKDGKVIWRLNDNRFCMSRGVLLTPDGRTILLPIDYDRPSRPKNRLQFFDKAGNLVTEGDLDASMFESGHHLMASLSPDGDYLAILGSFYKGKCLFFYDTRSGKELWRHYFPGSATVSQVKVARNGKYSIAGVSPKSSWNAFALYFFDKEGNIIQKHRVGGNPFYIKISGDDSVLTTLSRDEIHLFDVENQKLIWKYHHHRAWKHNAFQSIALSYDGGMTVASLYGKNRTGYLYAFDKEGNLVATKQTPFLGVSLALTPDARRVIIGREENKVLVYELK